MKAYPEEPAPAVGETTLEYPARWFESVDLSLEPSAADCEKLENPKSGWARLTSLPRSPETAFAEVVVSCDQVRGPKSLAYLLRNV